MLRRSAAAHRTSSPKNCAGTSGIAIARMPAERRLLDLYDTQIVGQLTVPYAGPSNVSYASSWSGRRLASGTVVFAEALKAVVDTGCACAASHQPSEAESGWA